MRRKGLQPDWRSGGIAARERGFISVGPYTVGFLFYTVLSFSSVSEDEDDGTAEFWRSVKVLSDKVSLLSLRGSELLERCSRAEAALLKRLRSSKLYTLNISSKSRQERKRYLSFGFQAGKQKISFVHLGVHELASFVQNPAGQYVVIHRNCSNYYLSAESVALFPEQYSGRPPYIIGQTVHIERRNVRQPPSPSTDISLMYG